MSVTGSSVYKNIRTPKVFGHKKYINSAAIYNQTKSKTHEDFIKSQDRLREYREQLNSKPG
jgi:hypothetical protein